VEKSMMTKICHVISSLKIGGAQQLLIRLCGSLKETEFTHTVICLTGETKLAKQLCDIGVNVHFLNMHGFIGGLQKVWQLREIIKMVKPDIVHTWLYHADFVTTAAMIGMGCPLVWSVHHANETFRDDKLSTKWLVKVLTLLSSKSPSAVIYCSEYAKKVHVTYGYKPKRSFVINNGIDTKLFIPSLMLRIAFRKQQGITNSTIVVGIVARYSPVKGYSVFLELACKLRTQFSDIKFVMLGTSVVNNNLSN